MADELLMRILDLDKIQDADIDATTVFAVELPNQTFQMTLEQLINFFPLATVDDKGVVTLASDSEAVAGSDDKKALTPRTGMKALESRISQATDGNRTTFIASEKALGEVNEVAENALPAKAGSIVDEDWNTITKAGCYTVSGATGENRPKAYTYGTLLVMRTSSSTTQTYLTDQANQMLSRTKWNVNTAWSDWVVIGGTANTPTSGQNLGGTDLDELSGYNLYDYGEFGFFYQDATAEAKPERNYPEQEPGTLIVTKSAMTGGHGCIQTYISRSGNLYTRSRYSSWSDWVKMYSTKNPPTPDDINALTGHTLSQNMRDDGKWILIADVYLPHSSSTAKISISGGAGFNGNTNYQSSEHRLIVRGGNKAGDASGSLYTDDLRGCPFESFGWVYVGSNHFEIYALSRADYSLGCLFEYTASTGNITPKNETQASKPSGMVLGAVVQSFNTEVVPSVEQIDLSYMGAVAIGTSVDALSYDELLMEFYDFGSADPHDLVYFDPSTYETKINQSGWYTLRAWVARAPKSHTISVALRVNGVQYSHANVETANQDKTNVLIVHIPMKLNAGDKVQVYSNIESTHVTGGSIEIRYDRPIQTTAKTKDIPKPILKR